MQKNPFLENFKPYIPAEASVRELTPFPLLIGTLLGIVFGASSLYLVLKVGLAVSFDNVKVASSPGRANLRLLEETAMLEVLLLSF